MTEDVQTLEVRATGEARRELRAILERELRAFRGQLAELDAACSHARAAFDRGEVAGAEVAELAERLARVKGEEGGEMVTAFRHKFTSARRSLGEIGMLPAAQFQGLLELVEHRLE